MPRFIQCASEYDTPLTVTFFRESGFPYWSIGLLIAGSMKITADGETRIHTQPFLGLTPPDCPYGTSFGGVGRTWIQSWAIFTPRSDWVEFMNWPSHIGKRGWIKLDGNVNEFRSLFTELDGYAAGISPLADRLAGNALERILLKAHALNPLAGAGGMDPRLDRAVKLLGSDLAESLTLEQVAKGANLSVSNLALLFRRELGTSPMHFREKERIRRASSLLLATNLPVQEIGRQVGFSNAFHFSTRFRRHAGVSPSAYRKA